MVTTNCGTTNQSVPLQPIENMFGTDGIRAKVGESPFTQPELFAMGYALGAWAVNTYGLNATLLLGHDTRISCSWVKAALKSGMLLHPVHVIDAGVLPTPAIVFLTMNVATINCGIIISASHNPYHDNGIKIIDGTTGKLSQIQEQRITEYFYTPIPAITFNELGQDKHWSKGAETYKTYVSSFFKKEFLTGKKIVLDCAHGATYIVALELFEHFGAEVISIGNNPTGVNINTNCGAVHVQQLQAKVLEVNADAGFAFDGDGDRVIAVNRLGQIKDGDALLALLLDHDIYKTTSSVVGTIMTNKGFENWLNSKHYPLVRTAVGDKYIARYMQKQNGTVLLGGEQSGHIILFDYLPTGDGIFTALRTMEAIITNQNHEMQTFSRMPQILINVPIKKKEDLSTEPFASLIKQYEDALPEGRIIVRFSGTESILRVMVEAHTQEEATNTATHLAKDLQQALGGTDNL